MIKIVNFSFNIKIFKIVVLNIAAYLYSELPVISFCVLCPNKFGKNIQCFTVSSQIGTTEYSHSPP